jgi:biofilm PGA synthesis protein PgaA
MELNTRYEFEKGGIASSGTSLFEASLYSRPIHYNFRAFLTSRYLTGNFQEGSLYYVLGGVGGEYKSTNFMTILEVNRSHYKGKSKMGSKMTVNVTPSDEWSFSGRADVNSIETPGRALANDISSHYFQAGINYAYNNALNLGVGLFDQEFTGNNAWHGANTYIQGQIIEKPRYTLDLRLDLGYRKSKTNDVPYYSPLRDSYVSLSPIFDQILYRNYEFSFRHKITPNVGRYFERGFKDSTTFGVSYEQTISHQNWYSLGYGFGRKRSTYDGVPEYATTLFVNFNIRL